MEMKMEVKRGAGKQNDRKIDRKKRGKGGQGEIKSMERMKEVKKMDVKGRARKKMKGRMD